MLISTERQTRLNDCEPLLHRNRDYEYMMSLTTENLLRSHYLEAGLIRMVNKPHHIHWGWDSTTSDIRGTVCGHWLSAAAHMYAEMHDEELLTKANKIVSEIGRCQESNGNGWAFPIPEKYLYWLREGRHPWAPQYVCHKNMMGLLDMYRYAGNEQALDIVKKCAEWFWHFTEDISRGTMDRMMELEETGGIMEFWADLYAVTGDERHLTLMRRYERPRLADGLLAGTDMLVNMHANTTIPEIQGYARAYEVTGEERYRKVVEAYWKMAVEERGSYATGGQTCGEVWTPMGQLAARLGDRNQEHCVVFNMMRLSQYLFRWTGDSRYADYYEKALWNGILAQGFFQEGINEVTERDEHHWKTVCYYLPMHPGSVKRWGSETEHFWCCHCTLLQANAEHHESIYYLEQRENGENRLYVAQYLPSTLETPLPEKVTAVLRRNPMAGTDGLADSSLNREILSRPHAEEYTLEIHSETAQVFSLCLRLPEWLDGSAEIRVDGVPVPYTVENGFAVISRQWQDAVIVIRMPKKLRCVALPDDNDMVAFVDGPVCLAGLVSEEHLLYGSPEHPEGTLLCADDERAWNCWKTGWKTYHQPFGIRFRPLYQIGEEPYTIYFPVRRTKPEEQGEA